MPLPMYRHHGHDTMVAIDSQIIIDSQMKGTFVADSRFDTTLQALVEFCEGGFDKPLVATYLAFGSQVLLLLAGSLHSACTGEEQ